MEMDKILKSFTTPLASFLKVFASTVLTMWITMPNLFDFSPANLKSLATAGIVSAVPVILNWLNPEYKNYGFNKSLEGKQNQQQS